MENRARVCICYIITATIITAFVYSLIHTHFTSIAKLGRLQEDVDQITKIILGRNPDEALIPQIDSYVKKRTQGLWNELTTVKKKLQLVEEKTNSNGGSCRNPPTDLEVVVPEEPNYALQSIGASILNVEDDPFHANGFLKNLIRFSYRNLPENVLNPSMELGSCYAFKGHKSVFTIKLSHKIVIRAITVEHIPEHSSLTGDTSNAPKGFFVYGVEDPENSQGEVHLGSFEYNNTKTKRAQTFYLNNDRNFRYCKIDVISNHGHPTHTCIYRIAVHGKLY